LFPSAGSWRVLFAVSQWNPLGILTLLIICGWFRLLQNDFKTPAIFFPGQRNHFLSVAVLAL
jgi:hypothetical protein